jgi:hypothetical protein
VIANTVYVEGCKTTGTLTSRPFGIIEFGYVQLPDYVVDTEPFKIYGFSDAAYTKEIFVSDDRGVRLTKDKMSPGPLELIEFTPSNYYAFVEEVTYTVIIKLRSAVYPSTRIIIQMPPTLTFSEATGCEITYTKANCEMNLQTNELTLTEIFANRVDEGTILKFVIDKALNPSGSQEAGPWGARTFGFFDGEYYEVDSGYSQTSFFALSGWILSTLSYTNTTTFSDDSEFEFSFLTEHDIPAGGLFEL